MGIDGLRQGVTAFVNKLDCLLWTLALGIDLGSRQQNITDYGWQVVCCLSDQGTPVKIQSEIQSIKLGLGPRVTKLLNIILFPNATAHVTNPCCCNCLTKYEPLCEHPKPAALPTRHRGKARGGPKDRHGSPLKRCSTWLARWKGYCDGCIKRHSRRQLQCGTRHRYAIEHAQTRFGWRWSDAGNDT